MVLWWEVEIVPPQAHDLTTCSPAGDVILEGSGMCRRWGLAGRNESWRASPWRLCLAPCFCHKLCFLAHNVKSPHHTQASSRPCQGELKLGYIFRLCLSSIAVTMTTKQLIIHKGKRKTGGKSTSKGKFRRELRQEVEPECSQVNWQEQALRWLDAAAV